MGTARDFQAATGKIQAVNQEVYGWKLCRQEDQVGDYCSRQIQLKMEKEGGVDHIPKRGNKTQGQLDAKADKRRYPCGQVLMYSTGFIYETFLPREQDDKYFSTWHCMMSELKHYSILEAILMAP